MKASGTLESALCARYRYVTNAIAWLRFVLRRRAGTFI
jgi:hypothetical protein